MTKLTWHHTEFGRRTDCEQYRIVREGDGWQLLDADWTPIGPWSPTIGAALNQADRVAARAAALPRGTSDTVGGVGLSDPVVP